MKTPYQVMLIPEGGPAESLPEHQERAEIADAFGSFSAAMMFPGQRVEIVVIDMRTREAVLDRVVTTNPKEESEPICLDCGLVGSECGCEPQGRFA